MMNTMMRYVTLSFLLALVVACKPAAKTETKLSATQGQVGPFVIPPSWRQAAWYVDGSNSSGCASDNNRTCSLATCGTAGDGPCATMASIAGRWGTWAPYLAQVTTINVISSNATSDYGWFQPQVAANVYLNIACTLPTPTWSTTLGTVTAKNRSTPTRLKAVIATAPGINPDQLVINTTHASAALTENNASTTWSFTQPVTQCAPPSCSTAEVDTWAVGDTVSGYVPYIVNLYQAQPVMVSDNVGSGLFGMYINNCQIQSPANELTTTFVPNGNVWIMNSIVQSNIDSGTAFATVGMPQFTNTDLIGVVRNTSGGTFQAGMIGNQGHFSQLFSPNFTLGFSIESNLVITGSQADSFEGGSTLSDVFLDGVSLATEYSFVNVTSFVWGSGVLSLNSGSFMEYPTGATGATTNLIFTGAFKLNNSTTACSHTNVAPDVVSCGISLTAAHLDAAQGAAGFGGYAYLPGGGTITNASQ